MAEKGRFEPADRDHRLRGEVLQQRDFFVGEAPDLVEATGGYVAEQSAVLAQWHEEHGA